MAPMASVGNVKAVRDELTQGNCFSINVWLIAVGQVDQDKVFPTPNINREMATIPIKRGEIMHQFQAIGDSIKENSKGERGEITTEVINSLELVMGGAGFQLYKFIEEHAGDRFIVIYQDCEKRIRHIAGTCLRPMILKSFIRKMDQEVTAITFRFENIALSLPKIYVGAIVKQDPEQVLVDSLTLNLVRGKEQYRFPENTSFTNLISVTGITPDMYGAHIELLGGSTSYPTKITSGDEFILVDSLPWYSSFGFSIIFRILDSNTLVEVTGSRNIKGAIWYDEDEGGIWDESYEDGIWHD